MENQLFVVFRPNVRKTTKKVFLPVKNNRFFVFLCRNQGIHESGLRLMKTSFLSQCVAELSKISICRSTTFEMSNMVPLHEKLHFHVYCLLLQYLAELKP